MKENTMKKLMLIFLFVIPFCKAADPNESWEYASWNRAVQDIPDLKDAEVLNLNDEHIDAIPDNLDFPHLKVLSLYENDLTAIPRAFRNIEMLFLDGNRIEAIPDDLKLSELTSLSLARNFITEVNPKKLLKQFPKLIWLDLRKNQLTIADLEKLLQAVKEAGRPMKIMATKPNKKSLSKIFL